MSAKLLPGLALVLGGALIAGTCPGKTNTNVSNFVPDIHATKIKAELGDVKAKANLGIMYLKGDGVQQNYAAAAKWLRLAAEHKVNENVMFSPSPLVLPR